MPKIIPEFNLNNLSIFIILVIVISTINITYSYNNKTYRCIDGDTFAYGKTHYRLSYIDTPEIGELNYFEATKFTCDFINDNKVKLKKQGKDIYSRTLVTVSRKNFKGNEENLSTELILNCLAEPFYKKTTYEINQLYRLCQHQ